MKLLIFVVLTLLSSIYCQDAVCSYNGIYAPNPSYICSCYSRFYGYSCSNVTSSQSCTINTPSKLKVDFRPTLSVLGGLLRFDVRLPIVNNRYETQVSIQNSKNAYCNFPGPTSSQSHSSVSPCYNNIRFDVPWDSQAYNCSWDITSTATEEFHNGIVYVTQRENVGTSGPIIRTIKTGLPIQIKFVKSITISANINYQPVPFLVDAAITRLEFIKGPPKSGIIEFITVTDYPYRIDSSHPMNVSSSNSGLNFNVVEITTDECIPSSTCTQQFRVIIGLQNETVCSFTGVHNVTFDFGCFNNSSGCSNMASYISLYINSEDFCATANINVGLSSSFLTFKDRSLLIPSSTFSAGTFVYLRAFLFANVQIVNQTLQRFQWTLNSTKVLFDNGLITADGIAESFTGNGSAMGFQLLQSHIGNVAPGSQMTISATILVKYKASPNSDIMERLETTEVYLNPGEEGFQNTKATSTIYIEQVASFGVRNSFGILVLLLSFVYILFN